MDPRQRDLPPLPGSDRDTLKYDRTDSFYKKRPSDVWTGAIEQTEIKDPSKCEHYFEETKTGVECTKCHFGLLGTELTTREGHVFFGDQKIL